MGDDKQRDTWLKAAWRRHNRPYECELTAKAVRTRHNSFMFDDVVLLDDRIVAEGKSAGREDGRNRGLKEGEGMGQSKGFRVLAEMGFCRGCCLAWLAMHEEDRDRFPFSEKAVTSMRAVAKLAETVPRGNTRDADAAQVAQRVRARFRAVTSMVGLPVVFDSKGQAEAKDFSF